MVFKYSIKLLNKNNAAFVINFIYVMGDYVFRLPINMQDLFGRFACFSCEKEISW